jgi:hypothetical protein
MGSQANSQQTVNFSGGSDPDGETIYHYKVSRVDTGMTFTSTEAYLTNAEYGTTKTDVTFYVAAKVSANTNYTFDVKVYDPITDELSVDVKTFTVTITPIYYTTAPNITDPTTTGWEWVWDPTPTYVGGAYNTGWNATVSAYSASIET